VAFYTNTNRMCSFVAVVVSTSRFVPVKSGNAGLS